MHFVFAVQGRYSLINRRWNDELYKYMAGIISEQGHKAYVINGMPDHIHALVSMNPSQSPSDLMYHVKKNSSAWINKNRYVMGRFSWQEGFGAFTYCKSSIPNVASYIENQEEHHKKKSFREEYIELLKSYGIDYNDKYIFITP
jgi:REP element-mobilizing transposase RayT